MMKRNICSSPASSAVGRRGRLRLWQLDAATRIEDLRLPPSNRFEPLEGDLAGIVAYH
jgi:plasmid maintenance system killer protein